MRKRGKGGSPMRKKGKGGNPVRKRGKFGNPMRKRGKGGNPAMRKRGHWCAFSGNYPGRNYASLAKKDVGIEDIFNTETLSS